MSRAAWTTTCAYSAIPSSHRFLLLRLYLISRFSSLTRSPSGAINTIAGAQALRIVARDTISDAAGVVIIAIITPALGMLGYKYVQLYEKWFWIPTPITFVILLGCAGKHLVNVPMGTCVDFWLVFFLFLFSSLRCGDGGGRREKSARPLGVGARRAAGCGQGAVLIPVVGNFGRFCMVLLVLSAVANNIINVYSMGLFISVVGIWLAKVPRLIWPIVITAIYIPIAIAGANSFSSSLENFMNVLGYWHGDGDGADLVHRQDRRPRQRRGGPLRGRHRVRARGHVCGDRVVLPLLLPSS